MHTTGNNQILSERVFLRASRGGGAIANKEEEEPYEFEEAVAITAMDTRRLPNQTRTQADRKGKEGRKRLTNKLYHRTLPRRFRNGLGVGRITRGSLLS